MFNNENINDNYCSYPDLFIKIKEYIPKDKIIYDPFYCDGQIKKTFEEMKVKKIIHEDTDFFNTIDNIDYDIIISNMPFSKRKKILEVLHKKNKPFILTLFPRVLSCKWFLDLFGDNNLQLIIPKQRSKCYNPSNKKDNYTPPNGMFYFCWKMNLEKDLIII